jgi:3-deoxy-D-arabino-heptulosonate 7-phosphate (DAHP) synthase
MSDGPQSLDFKGFEELMKEVRAIATALHRDALFTQVEQHQ